MHVEVMASPESFGITGRQCKAVYEVLADGGTFTLSEIKKVMSLSGVKAAETGISARIRDINKAFRINDAPYRVVHRPFKKNSNHMVYWIKEISPDRA